MEFDYNLSTELSNILYWGRVNSVFAKSDYLENEEINYGVEIKPLSNCVIKGIYPLIDIIPFDQPICSVEVHFKSRLISTIHFIVVDIPNPVLTSSMLRDFGDESSIDHYGIIKSEITLSEIRKIKSIQAQFIDRTGTRTTRFELRGLDISILRQDKIIFQSTFKKEKLEKSFEEVAKEIKSGDKLLIENISCFLEEYENQRRIERKFNYPVVTVKK